MNLILFSREELATALPRSDPRADHILKILKVEPGQSFDVGRINGPRGKARLEGIEAECLRFSYNWDEKIPSLYPLDLWVSFCRPQTCRRILQECTSLGIRSITFFDTEKCEPSYRCSRLWSGGEASRLLIRGAEQAFCTQVPNLHLNSTLIETLASNSLSGTRLAMDNYESTEILGQNGPLLAPVTLAVGGERGWSKVERDALRANGFSLADLGDRVLRTETACIAALSIIRNQLTD